jgi:hypothetical protein
MVMVQGKDDFLDGSEQIREREMELVFDDDSQED